MSVMVEPAVKPWSRSPLLRLLPIVLIAAAVVAVYWPLPGYGYSGFDDEANFYGNQWLMPPRWESVVRYWARPAFALYVPVTHTAWVAVAAVAYRDRPVPTEALPPTLFHCASIAVHALAAVAAFALLGRLTGSRAAAACGALLFALHPVQVESVAWTSGLKDLLAGMFGLTALWLYVSAAYARAPITAGADDGGAAAAPPGPWRARYALATGCFVLALLSKPSAVVVPVVAAVIDALLVRRPVRTIAAWTAPWLALSAVIAVVGKLVQPGTGLETASLVMRPVVALDALGFYARQVVAPVTLTIDYGRAPGRLSRFADAYFLWIIPVALAAVAVVTRRRAPWVAAGLGSAGVFVLPVLGLVKFDFQFYSTVSDHYLYAAMVGPALILAFALARYGNRFAYPVVAVVLVGLGVRSAVQLRHWESSFTLYTHALRANPDSLAANGNLGHIYLERSRAARKAGDEAGFSAASDRAIELFQNTLRLAPENAKMHRYLGDAYRTRGKPLAAIDHYRASLAADPRNGSTYAALAMALGLAGDLRGAADAMRQAIEIDPEIPNARQTLAAIEDQLRATPAPAR